MSARLDLLDRAPDACCRLGELRRLHAGELRGADEARVRAHTAACAGCAARLAELGAEAERFAREVDVAAESARVLERLEREEVKGATRLVDHLRTWLLAPQAKLAAAAIAVLLVAGPVALYTGGPGSIERGGTRTKGGAGLELYVKDAAGVRQAADGEALHAGDQIQLRYRAAGKQFVFVVSIAGSGVITPLWPDTPSESVAVTPSGTHVLDGSVILDDARGPERVVALFSERPLSYGEVRAALEPKVAAAGDVAELEHLELEDRGVDAATILFRKE